MFKAKLTLILWIKKEKKKRKKENRRLHAHSQTYRESIGYEGAYV